MDQRDVVYGDDVYEKIKDYVGFEVRNEFEFTPKAYREHAPKETWPVFVLRSRDGISAAKAEDNFADVRVDNKDPDGYSMRPLGGSSRITLLKDGILEVRNLPMEGMQRFLFFRRERRDSRLLDMGESLYTDRNGQIVEQPKKVGIEHVLEKMRPKLQVAVADAINERECLSEEEKTGLPSWPNATLAKA